jgi:opacity protein-like surface antigen
MLCQIGWAMNSDRKLAVAGIVIFLLTRALDTGAAESSSSLLDKFSTDSIFEHSRFESSLNSGVLLSPFVATKHRPTINYTITSLQLGYMITDVHGGGLFRGNFEMVGDAFGSAVYKGIGSYVAGATLWVRYNFVQPSWRLVPYAQGGGGFVVTDIDREIVGQEFNFNLDLGVGFRYFLGSRWSVAMEYRYQHISNANLGKKNLGINAHGPILGVSFFF